MRSLAILSLLGLLLAISFIVGLSSGAMSIPAPELWQTLTGNGSEPARTVVLELRLPRLLAALAVGGMLALAGAMMQVLLGNPLADPYVLGVSGGAASAALIAMLLGAGSLGLHGAAFGGALVSIAMVFGLARGRGSWTPTRLLLTGVVVAAGWGALIGFLLSVAPERNLRGMLFWLMGDLGHAGNADAGIAVLLLAMLIALPLARSLNLLARGELQAAVLGVNVHPLRIQLYLLASLLTAMAVTIGGSIGFIGLVVPHILRLLIGSDHRLLLPASVMLGALLLILADTLARTLWAPQQLPVGVLTALLGVPLFLYLLQRSGANVARVPGP